MQVIGQVVANKNSIFETPVGKLLKVTFKNYFVDTKILQTQIKSINYK